MSSPSISKPRSSRPTRTAPRPNVRTIPAKEIAAAVSRNAVRKEKIERARKLVADPNYPPPKVIQSVARLLARTWEGEAKARSK